MILLFILSYHLLGHGSRSLPFCLLPSEFAFSYSTGSVATRFLPTRFSLEFCLLCDSVVCKAAGAQGFKSKISRLLQKIILAAFICFYFLAS